VPIHDQGYRHYQGTRAPHGGAWWIIARSHMATLLLYRWFQILLLVSFAPFVVRAVQIYFASTNAQVAEFLATTPDTFRDFLSQQRLSVFLVVIMQSGLIADDRRTNALQLYLSKPLTRVEYVLGKLVPPVAFVLGVTLLPALLLLILQIVFSGSLAFLRANLFLLPAIKATMTGAWTFLQGAWAMIVGIFTLNGDKLREGVLQTWNGISTLLGGWPAKMVQAGVDMVRGLVSGIGSMASSVRDAIAGVAGGAIDSFKAKLGIHSPSRVFAQLGDFTMQGLTGGLDGGRDRAVQSVVGLGDRMRRAGAGIALAAAVTPVVPVSSAPVLAPSTGAAGSAQAGGNTYHITIQAGAGADAQAIAQAVRAELDRRDRESASRLNSRLTD